MGRGTLFGEHQPAVRQKDMVRTLGLAIVELRRAVEHADWDAARTSSWKCLGLGGGALTSLAIEDSQRAAALAHRDEVGSGVVDHLKHAAGSERGRARLREARTHLAASRPDVAARLSHLIDKLVDGDTSSLDALTRERPARSRSAGHDLAVAARLRGLLGLLHTNLNVLIAREHEGGDLDRDNAKSAVRDFEHRLRDSQQRVFRAAGSAKRDAIVDAADAMVRRLEHSLPDLAAGLARCHRTAQKLRSGGQGQAAEAMGEIARQGGSLLREAVASYAAALRVGAEAALGWSQAAASLIEHAKAQPFDASLPDAPNVDLSMLVDAKDGDGVEVAGFVASAAGVHPAGEKLVGRIELLDPSSGASAWIAGVYMHPRHIGITSGSYVRAVGKYEKASKLRGGHPTVEIAALPLVEHARHSWRHEFLLLALPWYSPWPNRLHVSWSMGPHVPESDGEGPNQGAGELIYSPIARKES